MWGECLTEYTDFIVSGEIATFCRPRGLGSLTRLAPSLWDGDWSLIRPRMVRGLMDLEDPVSGRLNGTHEIFVYRDENFRFINYAYHEYCKNRENFELNGYNISKSIDKIDTIEDQYIRRAIEEISVKVKNISEWSALVILNYQLGKEIKKLSVASWEKIITNHSTLVEPLVVKGQPRTHPPGRSEMRRVSDLIRNAFRRIDAPQQIELFLGRGERES